ncbi:hypothetical protein FRX31_014620 [Thalictrum thalictroides]|uniref:Uncharacterized protein n=1 Tax=Thalictrum thalictroides TaxID=46969 RepID=A0A7J6WEK6_THATH|nr:hypothetical protein FRX31_014620 [Thalictrum thalictroides]
MSKTDRLNVKKNGLFFIVLDGSEAQNLIGIESSNGCAHSVFYSATWPREKKNKKKSKKVKQGRRKLLFSAPFEELFFVQFITVISTSCQNGEVYSRRTSQDYGPET